MPMLETMAQFVLADHMGGGAFVPPLGHMGYKRLLSRMRGPYPTKDGYLALVVYTDKHWRAFSQLVGCPDLVDTDPRFPTRKLARSMPRTWAAYLAAHLPQQDHRGMDRGCCSEADIPASPVNADRGRCSTIRI